MLRSILHQLNQGFFGSLPRPLPHYLKRESRLNMKSSPKQLSPLSTEETASPRGQGTVQGSRGSEVDMGQVSPSLLPKHPGAQSCGPHSRTGGAGLRGRAFLRLSGVPVASVLEERVKPSPGSGGCASSRWEHWWPQAASPTPLRAHFSAASTGANGLSQLLHPTH